MSRWPTREAQQGGYAGLCVGGPDDGKFMASQAPTYRAVSPPEEHWKTSWGSAFPKEDLRTETVTYHWVEGLRGPNAIDFFVPEGQTKEDALGAIINSYVRKKR